MIDNLTNAPSKTPGLFEQSDMDLFEVNDEGTVLYCRTKGEKPFFENSAASIVGRNLFDEVAPLENAAELRRHFNKFIKSGYATDNFTFFCRVKDLEIPAKVLLVRIIERSDSEREKTTIVDIRKIQM